MNKLVLIVVSLSLAACQPDTKNLEKKIDDLAKNQKDMMAMIAKGGGGGAGAGQQRPQRPEPDRAKTYAVPIDNDAFEGPATAKITIVKAIDYA